MRFSSSPAQRRILAEADIKRTPRGNRRRQVCRSINHFRRVLAGDSGLQLRGSHRGKKSKNAAMDRSSQMDCCEVNSATSQRLCSFFPSSLSLLGRCSSPWYNSITVSRLTFWRPLLPYGYRYIKHPMRDRVLTSGHSDAQTQSGIGCFITVRVWQQWTSSG